jgi:hypothetical protein
MILFHAVVENELVILPTQGEKEEKGSTRSKMGDDVESARFVN